MSDPSPPRARIPPRVRVPWVRVPRVRAHPKPKPNQVLLSDAEVTAEIRIVDLGLARFFSPQER